MKDLRSNAIDGARWTTISAVFMGVVHTLQLGLLARYLTPYDFGLFAIVQVLVTISQFLLDSGVSIAIIRDRSLGREALSTLFWLGFIVGGILFLLLLAASPMTAAFFAMPELASLIFAFSFVFLILPFGQQYCVLMRKDMRFFELSLLEMVGTTITFVVSLVLAVEGFGARALVYASLANVTFSSATCLLIGLRRYYVPGLHLDFTKAGSALNFGIFQLGDRFVWLLSREMDQLILGKLLGATSLGYYTMARKLISLPLQRINPIFNRVAFPIFSELQDDDRRLEHYYTRGQTILMTMSMPAMIGIALVADELVGIYLGPGWETVAVLVKILALFGVLLSFDNPGGALLLTRGRADLSFYRNCVCLALSWLTTTLILLRFGTVESVAWAQLAWSLPMAPFLHALYARIGRVGYRQLLWKLSRIALMCALMGAAVELTSAGLAGWSQLNRLVAMVATGFMAYTIALAALDGETFRFFLRGGRD